MLKLLYCLRASKTALEMKRAVKSEMATPKESETAKPLIGPVPNWKSTRAVIKYLKTETPMRPVRNRQRTPTIRSHSLANWPRVVM